MGSASGWALNGGGVVTIIHGGKGPQITIVTPNPPTPKDHLITSLPAWTAGARRAPVLPVPRAAVPSDTVTLARFLLGKVLVRDLGGERLTGRIVETEAYLENDPACHAYRGITPRNRSLFLTVGHAYVYICYGTSFLLNVSSGSQGVGCGVLLRALEPLAGIERMQDARRGSRLRDLARGPGRLTAALHLDRRQDGMDMFAPGPLCIGGDGTVVESIGESVRIGLTRGADARLRYFVGGSEFLSGPRRLNAVPRTGGA